MATDIELITLAKSILDAGLAALSISATVKRGNQPTQQGFVGGPGVYIWPIDGDKYGFQSRDDKYDSTAGHIVHTERYRCETPFQFTCIALTGDNTFTSGDLAFNCAALLQSDAAIATMQAADVAVLRVSQVRNVPFLDDKNVYKHSASFDVVFTHHREIVGTVPAIETITFNADRV